MKNKVNVLNLGILIILSACMIVSCGKIPCQEVIYGVWKGEFQGKELLFKFESDQTCVWSFRNKESNSVEILNGNFEIDFSKKPITLSVRNIQQINHPLHTILQFKEVDELIIAEFAPRWKLRPLSFDHNTSISFKRVNDMRMGTKYQCEEIGDNI